MRIAYIYREMHVTHEISAKNIKHKDVNTFPLTLSIEANLKILQLYRNSSRNIGI